MRIPITFAQLEQKVRELVAANSQYRYPRIDDSGCLYNACGEQPACIFGRAFLELGYPVPMTFEGFSIKEVLIAWLVEGESLSERDLAWANKLQLKQDQGATWQDALDFADGAKDEEDA